MYVIEDITSKNSPSCDESCRTLII